MPTKAAILLAVSTIAMMLIPAAAHAADNQRLTAQRSGVIAAVTVDWTSRNGFVLRSGRLSDTSCDNQPVYFYVSVPGFQYPTHWNRSGCGTTATFGPLAGSLSSNIPFLRLTACRDTFNPECATSVASDNPYVL